MPKVFFADNVSIKSRLLDSMLHVLKHALALETFWPKLWIFQQFSLLGEGGGGGGVLTEMTYAIGTCRRRTKHLQ